MSLKPKRILFVCTGNAGRSQTAEALVLNTGNENVCVQSAGVDPWDHLHPVAVKLLDERGIDTSSHSPKHVRTMIDQEFDVVITLGDRALAETPDLPGNPRRIHWEIGDPADADGTPAQEQVFRNTLAAIEERLDQLLREV